MKTTSKSVRILDFTIKEVAIDIVGISPLIVHAWSEKSKKMIRDKKEGAAKNKKHELWSANDEYESSKHRSPQGWEGFPATGFKAAMIRGAKMIGLEMKTTQMAFFIRADCAETQLIRIIGDSRLREDMVRVGMGSADLRIRAEYPVWSATLVVEFNEGIISLDQVYQLVKAAGYGCGIGEMRPEKGKFNYGRFALKDEKRIE
jgi:hypothetical protein